MSEKENLLNKFNELSQFVETLRVVDDKTWEKPIKENKWAVQDIISHLILWDKYFLEEAIEKIVSKQKLTLKHLDFDEFNKNAPVFAKQYRRDDLINKTIYYRTELIKQIQGISEEDLYFEHIDGDGNIFTIHGYLNGFIPHDEQHIREIKEFLK